MRTPDAKNILIEFFKSKNIPFPANASEEELAILLKKDKKNWSLLHQEQLQYQKIIEENIKHEDKVLKICQNIIKCMTLQTEFYDVIVPPDGDL